MPIRFPEGKYKLKPCDIGYRVVLTVESLTRKDDSQKLKGLRTINLNKENPLEARAEAFAIAKGWRHILSFESLDGMGIFYSEPSAKESSKYWGNDEDIFYYNIAIYCVDESMYGDKKEKIIYDTDYGRPLEMKYSDMVAELIDELIWEHQLYKKYGYSTEGFEEELSGEDYDYKEESIYILDSLTQLVKLEPVELNV